MGDSQAGGISKLLQAETLAQEIVNRARTGAHHLARLLRPEATFQACSA
jgi:hypothetical protein